MKYNIGIDLGGTNIAAGLVTLDGKIVARASTPTLPGRPHEEILKDMADLGIQVVADAGATMDDVGWVGVGSPGTADTKAGIVIFANNLFWHHIPVAKEIQKYIDKPVYVDNDANVAGLAEAVAGACKDYDNSIFLTLGTGVGGGIILNKQVFSGSHNVGAEVGHMITVIDGEQCTCGNKGCWETYTSATALIREGRKSAEKNPNGAIAKAVNGNLDDISAKTVMDAAKDGDPEASAIFDNYIHYMAMGIITLINTFDPEIFALGGGVAKAGDFLLDALRAEVHKYIFYKDVPYGSIVLAELGNDAGIIGAAMLGLGK